MTKSNEEQEQEAIAAKQKQQAQAQAQAQAQQQQRAQVITNNAPQQTVPNVTPSRVQQLNQEQNTIEQNIEGDQQATKTNEDLKTLKRLVGLASPVVENQQETIEQKDAAGNVNQVPVTKKVTTGYTYYAVDGKPFEEWVQETFGGDVTVNTQENTITYNKPIEEIVSKEPQKEGQEQGAEGTLKKGVRTENK